MSNILFLQIHVKLLLQVFNLNVSHLVYLFCIIKQILSNITSVVVKPKCMSTLFVFVSSLDCIIVFHFNILDPKINNVGQCKSETVHFNNVDRLSCHVDLGHRLYKCPFIRGKRPHSHEYIKGRRNVPVLPYNFGYLLPPLNFSQLS